ncbi:hypothetical protein PVL29_027109 [Vitis rotundifolia]|uniref:Uncharacterized protein n=2 Tax=Vitis rotundifolia TaxID=103349 RepID=A0AA38YIC5_VITRO|nr:hypothetical protein PVL29_027109 [Vitis rotundifolia]
MGFWTLFEVASMPILQVLIIGSLGAFLATGYCNILPADARKSVNKIVFVAFTPSLMFAGLAQTITFQNMISWWFMPVNIGLTFLFGGILGWLVVKILKPKPHLEGLIMATCSSGNLGNLLLIVIPAICEEDGSPFGDHASCGASGLSYASLSTALGGIFIWTYTYQLIRSSVTKYYAIRDVKDVIQVPNKELDANKETHLLKGEDQEHDTSNFPPSKSTGEDVEKQVIVSQQSAGSLEDSKVSFWARVAGIGRQIMKELLSPPTLGAVLGFVFGAVPWLKNILIGDAAPLRVVQDSVKLLANGTIPCITLILGGNLTRGIRSSGIKPSIIIAVICVRYFILPLIGIAVVRAASNLGFVLSDPLYLYVLMIQFTLPPAMNIGTMTELFNVGQEECSVLFLWTYLFAALALTAWSTVYMWILS